MLHLGSRRKILLAILKPSPLTREHQPTGTCSRTCSSALSELRTTLESRIRATLPTSDTLGIRTVTAVLCPSESGGNHAGRHAETGNARQLTVPTPLPRRSLAVVLQRRSISRVTPAKASLGIWI